MTLRDIKELLKFAIGIEESFSNFEKECLKLSVELARSVDELFVLALFCFGESQRRFDYYRRVRKLFG